MKGKFTKRICWVCIGLFICAIIALWGLAGCNEQNLDELKEIPKMEYATEGKNSDMIGRSDIAYHFSMQRGFNNVDIKVPTDIKVALFDGRYREIDYYWWLKFNKWFEKLKFENGIMPIDPKQNLDCDNFAMLYKSVLGISGYKSGEPDEPAVAVMVVQQRNAWGGIPTGNLHMVNLVFTRHGWFVFEPQTGEKVLLENYPNAEYVQYILL